MSISFLSSMECFGGDLGVVKRTPSKWGIFLGHLGDVNWISSSWGTFIGHLGDVHYIPLKPGKCGSGDYHWIPFKWKKFKGHLSDVNWIPNPSWRHFGTLVILIGDLSSGGRL